MSIYTTHAPTIRLFFSYYSAVVYATLAGGGWRQSLAGCALPFSDESDFLAVFPAFFLGYFGDRLRFQHAWMQCQGSREEDK